MARSRGPADEAELHGDGETRKNRRADVPATPINGPLSGSTTLENPDGSITKDNAHYGHPKYEALFLGEVKFWLREFGESFEEGRLERLMLIPETPKDW